MTRKNTLVNVPWHDIEAPSREKLSCRLSLVEFFLSRHTLKLVKDALASRIYIRNVLKLRSAVDFKCSYGTTLREGE